MITLTIAAQKGGAGKTTLAAHLGVQAARSGRRVLLADLDPQQSLTKWRKRREGYDVHLACLPQVVELISAAAVDGYDMVIIDTLPRAATNTLAAIQAASLVLVPMQPTILDVDAMDTMAEVLEAARASKRTHVVLNRCPPTRGSG
ncbi:MAG: ParA family protein [Rhodospirillaceae bacterium]